MEDIMAWRDDKARATLIRDAAGSVQPGKAPRTFAELLFGYTNVEDLANCDASSLAFLAEQAWEHVQQRTAGSADIRVVNPMMPDGREISVLEVLNDNMPFLFDSTMAELAEQSIEVTLVTHPIIAVERDDRGKLLRFYGETLPAGTKGARESLIHIHITRLDAEADRQKLIGGLTRTLNDVRACVTDWQAMRDRAEEAIKTFSSNPPPLPIDEVAEANQFLQWLCADNFTFLGVREYRFSPDRDASDDITTGEGLGILRDPDVKVLRRGSEMVVMTPEIREFMREPTLLIVIKANDHLLKDLLFDDAGHCMIATHATKAGMRYRYYVSQPGLHGEARTAKLGSVSRVTAPDIEQTIVSALRKHLTDNQPRGEINDEQIRFDRSTLARLLSRVEVQRNQLVISLRPTNDTTQPAVFSIPWQKPPSK